MKDGRKTWPGKEEDGPEGIEKWGRTRSPTPNPGGENAGAMKNALAAENNSGAAESAGALESSSEAAAEAAGAAESS